MKERITKLLTSMVLLAVLAAAGCDDDEPTVLEPIDQLPPLTATGENTFGCLVNGEAWVTATSIRSTAVYQGGFLQIGANIEEREREQAIGIDLNKDLEVGIFEITDFDPADAELRDLTKRCNFLTDNNVKGILNITFVDTNRFIVAGTFEFDAVSADCQDTIRVTDGRFDLNYIP